MVRAGYVGAQISWHLYADSVTRNVNWLSMTSTSSLQRLRTASGSTPWAPSGVCCSFCILAIVTQYVKTCYVRTLYTPCRRMSYLGVVEHQLQRRPLKCTGMERVFCKVRIHSTTTLNNSRWCSSSHSFHHWFSFCIIAGSSVDII